jgi:hypothetical protein
LFTFPTLLRLPLSYVFVVVVVIVVVVFVFVVIIIVIEEEHATLRGVFKTKGVCEKVKCPVTYNKEHSTKNIHTYTPCILHLHPN